MKYDTSECRYPEVNELVDVAKQVFQRISASDRKHVESVCDVVVFWDGGRQVGAFSAVDRHVRVFVHDLILFSDAGQQGVLAHEFGHAFDFAESGEHMSKTIKVKLEKRADDHARRWGFANEIGIRDREDQTMSVAAREP